MFVKVITSLLPILNISVMDPLELYLNKWQLAFSISWMYQPKDQILHMCLAGCVFLFLTCFLCLYVFGCDFSSCLCVIWNFASKLRNLPTFTDIINNIKDHSHLIKDHSHLSKTVVAMKMLKPQVCPVSILQCYCKLKFPLKRLKTNKSDSVRVIKNDQVV